MASTGERINYSLRPAKHIERRMLCDAFRRLHPFSEVSSYRYIGLGSFYFSDFSLFHKALGIRDMVSIEKDVDNQERFEFNRPFNSIALEFGESNAVLPRLDWSQKTIIWLDYDGKLSKSHLTDVSFICTNAQPASMMLITVNATADHYSTPAVQRLADLKRRVGALKVPTDIKGGQLTGNGLSDVYRRIVENEILSALSIRNGAVAPESRLRYQQLFFIEYADNAQMLTVGGLLFAESQRAKLAECQFSQLPFYRPGNSSLRIEVPCVTYREIRHLGSQLPLVGAQPIKGAGISDIEIDQYSRVYRYFPNFVDADI